LFFTSNDILKWLEDCPRAKPFGFLRPEMSSNSANAAGIFWGEAVSAGKAAL